MPDALLTPEQVPPTLRPLYDGTIVEKVWREANGELWIFSAFDVNSFPSWDAWGQSFHDARQDIRVNKLEQYDPKVCWNYPEIAFVAAQNQLEELRAATQAMLDSRGGHYVAGHFEKNGHKNGVTTAADLVKPAPQVQQQFECKITLRSYQERAVRQLADLIKRGVRRILLVGPTGMGKMVLAAYLMGQTSRKGNPSLFLADFRELIGQCQEKLQSFGVPCGVIMAGNADRNLSLAQVASKDTLWARAFRGDKMEPPKSKLLICDEAHKSRSETWSKIIEHYKDSVILGMTATPARQDGKGLGSAYDAMVTVATYKELREGGFIVPAVVYAPTKPDLKGLKIVAGDYEQKGLRERMDKPMLVGDVVKDWRKRADGRMTVVYGSGVLHSIHLRNEFQKFGVSAAHIDAKNTSLAEREDILGKFHDGLLTVVCNYGILTTGWDEPAVSCMVSARPTRSFSLWRQMVGRVLRAHPGKKDAIILDHSGAVFRHGFPDEDIEWELSPDKSVNDKVKERLAKEAKEQREPFACPKCYAVYRGPQCPACGYKPEPRERAVVMQPGELKEVKREALRREHTLDQKQKTWNECLGWAVGTGAKLGAAGHRYKQVYGVFPDSSLNRVPRGKRQWNMDSKEFWTALMDYEKLGLEMPENET